MKKLFLGLAIALVLVPSLSFASTSQTDLEKKHVELLEQLIVLLKAQLEQLLQQRAALPQVLGVSTSTNSIVSTTTKKRSGGGGGGGSSSGTSASLTLAMIGGLDNSFSVTTNQPLTPGRIVVTGLKTSLSIFDLVSNVPTTMVLKVGLSSGGYLDVMMVLDKSNRTYSADMRALLPPGTSYTGEFKLVVPEYFKPAYIEYSVFMETNGVTRTIVMENKGDVVASITPNEDSPESLFIGIDTILPSLNRRMFDFDVKNTGGAKAQLNDLSIDYSNSLNLTGSSLITKTQLLINGTSYVGVVGSSSIQFSNLSQIINPNTITTASLGVSFSPQNPIPNSQDVSFSVSSTNVNMSRISNNTSVSLSSVILTSETHELGKVDAGTLKFSLSNNNPDAATIEVEENIITPGIVIFEYTLEAEDADIALQTLFVNLETNDDIDDVISNIKLQINGDVYNAISRYPELAADATTSATYRFEIGGDVIISAEESVEAQVITSFKKLLNNYPEGTVIQAKVTMTERDLTEAVGVGAIEDFEGVAIGDVHTLRSSGILVEVSDDSVVVTAGDLPNDDYATFTINLDVTAFEQDIYIKTNPVNSIVTNILNGAGVAVAGVTSNTLNSTADQSGGYFMIGEGETERFTIQVTFDPEMITSARLQLTSILFDENTTAGGEKTWLALPASDYRTSVVTVVN